jgi:hypothetical protein
MFSLRLFAPPNLILMERRIGMPSLTADGDLCGFALGIIRDKRFSGNYGLMALDT